MKAKFVEVTNVGRFLAGCDRVEHRGAPEKSWQLVMGEPGYGKTRTLAWHTLHTDSIIIRAKAGWTYNWMLRDLVTELGLLPQRSKEKLYDQVTTACAIQQKHIIVDEIEHAMADRKIIEGFRDISDEVEVPIIIAGMKGVERRLKRYPQIYSRIACVTEFRPCSLADVQKCCDDLLEIDVADDIAPLVLAHTGGRLRDIMNYLAELERIGKRKGGMICAADLGGKVLTNDGEARTTGAARVA